MPVIPLLFLFLAAVPRGASALTCPELVAQLNAEEAPAAGDPRPVRVGWFARKFFGESRIQYWLGRVREGKIRFTDRDPSKRPFPHDYVYRTIGQELIDLGEKAVPYIDSYVSLSVESGLLPTESAFFLTRIAGINDRARAEVFDRVFKAALNPKLKPEQREIAGHMLARLGPGIVPPERFKEMVDIAADAAHQTPAMRADMLRALTYFCVPQIREAIRDGVPYAQKDAWYRYFETGEELQGIPPDARAKTVSMLEALLDDKELGPRAAAALVFLSSGKKNRYEPEAAISGKIARNVAAGYAVLDPNERYTTNLALALLAKDGKVTSPPRYFVELAMSRGQPHAVRGGALRPLVLSVARYEENRKRSGEGFSREHATLVVELRRLLDDEEIQATKHPILKDLKKYVEEQETEKRRLDAAAEQEEKTRPTEGGLFRLPR